MIYSLTAIYVQKSLGSYETYILVIKNFSWWIFASPFTFGIFLPIESCELRRIWYIILKIFSFFSCDIQTGVLFASHITIKSMLEKIYAWYCSHIIWYFNKRIALFSAHISWWNDTERCNSTHSYSLTINILINIVNVPPTTNGPSVVAKNSVITEVNSSDICVNFVFSMPKTNHDTRVDNITEFRTQIAISQCFLLNE